MEQVAACASSGFVDKPMKALRGSALTVEKHGCVRHGNVPKPLSAQSVLFRKPARMRVASLRRTRFSCQSADRHPSGKSSLSRAPKVRARFCACSRVLSWIPVLSPCYTSNLPMSVRSEWEVMCSLLRENLALSRW